VSIIQIHEEAEMANCVAKWRNADYKVAFVPTMGALHKGHATLIEKAQNKAYKVVTSIFVNPTQFNDKADFERYPRLVEKDIEMLNSINCDVVFLPSVSTVYPNGQLSELEVDLNGIDNCMEGIKRPGHFKGVMQVVKRLLDLVKPDQAYFGLKDYQQYLIIKTMTKILKLDIDIIGVDTIREADGLALSSRNRLLSNEDREIAPVLYSILIEAAQRYKLKEPLVNIRIIAEERLSQLPGVIPEYFEIANANTLEPIHQYSNSPARAFIAANFGKIRLIDNVACSI
jgi:pantoate--beta-alanine ligase